MADLIDNKGILTMVNLDDLHESELNTYDTENIDELEESIRLYGLMEPLAVASDGDKYEILSGHRRYCALRQLCEHDGIQNMEIPCQVITDVSTDPVIRGLIIELANLEAREEIDTFKHCMHVVKLYHALCNGKESTILDRIQHTLSVSRRYARMYNTIFDRGDESLVQSLESRAKDKSETNEENEHVHIPIKTAERIAALPKEEQKEIVKEHDEGGDINQIVRKRTSMRDFDPIDYDADEEYGREIDLNSEFDDFDILNASVEDCIEYLDQNQTDLDDDIDTTNLISGLKRDDSHEKEQAAVRKWLGRIKRTADPAKLAEGDTELMTEIVGEIDHIMKLLAMD